MYGRTFIETNKSLDHYRKRCMDIHLKKLTQIRKTVGPLNSSEEAKRVEDSLNKRHLDKVRTHEFLKNGNNHSHF
jgi:hypothetical protein